MADNNFEEHPFIVIDFDSTFLQVEGMDELAAISLANNQNKVEILQRIHWLTNEAMNGQMPFSESLVERLKLLNANKKDIEKLIPILQEKVSLSFQRNKEFLQAFADRIYIVSAGFKEFIVPVVSAFGIAEENVFANEYLFDEQGNIIGADTANVLTEDKGKVKLLSKLNLPGKVLVIGDGYTDYEIKSAGLADKFFAFTENIKRNAVVQAADHITPSLDEFLYYNNLPMSLSYPKNRISVLLLENIHPHAVELFKAEGYNVETMSSALSEEELIEKIKDVSILGIRSKTQVSQKVLDAANRLIAVGAFCIGVNQIDVLGCLKKGVVVFNAPYSNSRSVVEMAIGEMIVLIRGIADKSQSLHKGEWIKSAKNSYEIRGKKLGIIGYGNIGTQLSVLAESLGMQVLYYDIADKLSLGNAKKCAHLDDLLSEADVITVHIDGRKENTNFIGKEQFAKMKDGVIFMNLARGYIVDLEALKEAILTKKVLGAGVDVFPHEPKNNKEPFESILQGLPNVLLTPHIGGSTEEAQFAIADFVPNKIIDYVNSGNTFNSVNFPNMVLPEFSVAHRLIHVHYNVPGIMAKINTVLSSHNINILGQFLKTNEDIGYVITDIDKEYDTEVIAALKAIPQTIKFRVLY